MKRNLLFLAAWCYGVLLFAQSPITLNNSNMPGSGDTLRYSNAQLNSLGNYTQTGTNFTWNFTSLTPVSQGVRSFKAAFQTPYAFYFIGINEYGEKIADTVGAGPFVMTNFYNYYKKQSSPVSAFIADGAGITFSGVPVPSYYSDKDELYMFPMTYPKYDSTTFKFSTPTNSVIPVKYSKTGYRVTVVDGWGTITTSYTTAPCLRLVTTQYSMDSIKYNAGPLPPFGWPNYQRSYQWISSSGKIPLLEISGNLIGNNFTVTQARYRDVPQVISRIEENNDFSAVLLYPNPVKDFLNFTVNPEPYEVSVLNLNGELLKSFLISAGSDSRIDVSALPAGMYIVKMKMNADSRSFKFVKE